MLRLTRQVMLVAVAMLFCAAVSFAADNVVQDVLADSLINRHLHEKLRKKLGNEDDLRALCSGLKICMDIDYEGCFEEDKKPWPHHKYDKEFCGVFKEVEKRGFLPDPNVTMAAEVYARLIYMKNRATITIIIKSTCNINALFKGRFNTKRNKLIAIKR